MGATLPAADISAGGAIAIAHCSGETDDASIFGPWENTENAISIYADGFEAGRTEKISLAGGCPIWIGFQASEKLVVATRPAGAVNVQVERFSLDGTRDNLFGVGGAREIQITGRELHGVTVKIDDLDRIVVGGLSYDPFETVGFEGVFDNCGFTNSIFLARLAEDGSVDSAFGSSPVSGVTEYLLGEYGFRSPALLSAFVHVTDHFIPALILEGGASGGIVVSAKVNLRGRDLDLGPAGTSRCPSWPGLGVTGGSPSFEPVAVKFTSAGHLDSTFGYYSTGRESLLYGGVDTDSTHHVLVGDPSGDLISIGSRESGSTSYLFAERISADGKSIVTSWANHGEISIDKEDLAGGLPRAAVGPNGRLYIATFERLIALNPDGELDSAFGGDGVLSDEGHANKALAVGPDFLFAGSSHWEVTLADILAYPSLTAQTYALRQPAPSCPAVPRTGCFDTWEKGKLIIIEKSGRENAKIAFLKGPEILARELGYPTHRPGTAYSVCVYGADDALAGSYAVERAGSEDCAGKVCWKTNVKGHRFKDKGGSSDAISGISLMAGPATKTKFLFKAKNNVRKGILNLPLGIAANLAGDARATAQVLRSDSPSCLSLEFSTVKKNDGVMFKALP